MSSGEGELVYLASRVQELLGSAKSVDDLDKAIEWCLDKVSSVSPAALSSSFLMFLACSVYCLLFIAKCPVFGA